MDYTEFFNKLRINFEQGLELMKRKNHDYAGEVDPFKNFRAAEALGVSVEQGILVRMSDKMARAANLLKIKQEQDLDGYRDIDGKPLGVTEESVKDTLIDLMNYSNILMVYLEYQRKGWMADKINDDGSSKVPFGRFGHCKTGCVVMHTRSELGHDLVAEPCQTNHVMSECRKVKCNICASFS